MVLPVPSDHDLSTITRERDHQWHAYSRQQPQTKMRPRKRRGARRVTPTELRVVRVVRTHEPQSNRGPISVSLTDRVVPQEETISVRWILRVLRAIPPTPPAAAKPARDAGTPPPLLRERSVGLAALWRNRFAACGIRMMRRPAAARSDGRCANASMHHYAPLCPTSRPYTPAPPDCVDGNAPEAPYRRACQRTLQGRVLPARLLHAGGCGPPAGHQVQSGLAAAPIEGRNHARRLGRVHRAIGDQPDCRATIPAEDVPWTAARALSITIQLQLRFERPDSLAFNSARILSRTNCARSFFAK